MNHHANNLSVLAPLSGEIIALEQVSDPVFSGKVLGDGIAIIPEDGKIYSPVNGTVTTVSSTLHAYGFSTESGLDILVHVGLETVSLKTTSAISVVATISKLLSSDTFADAVLA